MDWSAYDVNDEDNECSRFDDFNPAYQVCMKSKLPSASIGKFNLDSNSGDLSFVMWDNEVAQPENARAYILPCLGDSGSGQWITNGYKEEYEYIFKQVLVAVHANHWHVNYDDDQGVQFGPCGGVMYFPSINDYRWDAASSQVLTWKEIFDWIKDKAEIQ